MKNLPHPLGFSRLALTLFRLVFDYAEAVLVRSAHGALKIIGEGFPLGAGGMAVIRIALSLVIHPSADITYVLFHGILSSNPY
jgi:hypothetical protein